VKDVVHSKSNKHHNRDGLVLAELLPIPMHEGNDREDDHGDTEN
jgi:hypothetical protein